MILLVRFQSMLRLRMKIFATPECNTRRLKTTLANFKSIWKIYISNEKSLRLIVFHIKKSFKEKTNSYYKQQPKFKLLIRLWSNRKRLLVILKVRWVYLKEVIAKQLNSWNSYLRQRKPIVAVMKSCLNKIKRYIKRHIVANWRIG